jgi:hypothetical protein
MSGESPNWAFKEVGKRVPKRECPTSLDWAVYVDELRMLAASLIAKHEQPPVDPLLVEAREITAKYYDDHNIPNTARAIQAGHWDKGERVQTVLTALRRGVELAKEGAA